MRIIKGFQIQGSSAAIGAGLTVNLLAGLEPLTQVPANQHLIITGLATYSGADAATFGKVKWNFLANGIVMDGSLLDQTDQVGVQNQPMMLGAPLRIEGGQTLSVTAKNTDAVSHSAGVLLVGYYAVD